MLGSARQTGGQSTHSYPVSVKPGQFIHLVTPKNSPRNSTFRKQQRHSTQKNRPHKLQGLISLVGISEA